MTGEFIIEVRVWIFKKFIVLKRHFFFVLVKAFFRKVRNGVFIYFVP